MALSERLEILILGNGSGAVREFKKVSAAAQKELGAAQKEADKTGQSTSKMGDLIQKGSAYAVAGFAAVTVAAVAFAKASITVFDQAGEETRKFQAIAGGSAEAVSGLLAGSQILGTSADDLTAATAKLTIAEGTHADILGRLGVATKDANGNYRDQTAVLQDTFVALSNETSITQRNTDAKALFGKAYANILPLIAQSGALTNAESQAKADGLVLTQKQVDQAHENTVAQQKLQSAVKGLEVEIGSKLAPVLTNILSQWTEALQVFTKIPGALDSITGHSSMVGKALEQTSLGMFGYIQQLNDMIGRTQAHASATDDEIKMIDEAAHATGGSKTEILQYIEAQRTAGNVITNSTDLIAGFSAAHSGAEKNSEADAVATMSFADSLKAANDGLATAQGELDKTTKAIEDYFKGITGGLDVEATYQQSIDDLAEKLTKAGAVVDKHTGALDLNSQASRDNLTALEKTRDAIIAKGIEEAKTQHSVQAGTDAVQGMVNSLYQQILATTGSKDAAALYITQLGLTPDRLRTAIEQAGMGDAMNAIQAYKSTIDGLNGRTITVNVLSNFAASVGSGLDVQQHGGNVTRRAAGGPVEAGVPYWVGDKTRMSDAELFIPKESGRLAPANPSMGGGGYSGPQTIQIMLDRRVLAEASLASHYETERGS